MTESNESEPSQKPAAADPAGEQLELKLPDESAAPKDLGLWAGVLVLLTMIAWWPATTGTFQWRDSRAAASRNFVTPGALSRIWLERWQDPAAYGLPVYQPAALTAYYLEYQLGGHDAQGMPTPMAYHIASLVFTAASAILLWLTLRELKIPAAWLIAAVFALHPIHAEEVSWIDQQPIVLAGLFFLGSVCTYLLFMASYDLDLAERAAGKPGVDPAQTWGCFAGSILLSLLAMLSDPSAAVLPVLILLILRWKNRTTNRDVIAQSCLLAIGLALWLKNIGLTPADSGSVVHSGFAMQASAIGRGMTHTVGTLVAPFSLSIIYPQSTVIAGWIIAALTAVFLLGLYLLRAKSLFVAFASFALLAAASIDWFDASRLTAVSDAAAYLAMVPIAAMLIIFCRRAAHHLRLPLPPVQTAVGLSTVLLLVLGSMSWMRTHVFENPVALWQDTVAKHPGNPVAQASLAEELRLQAVTDTAEDNKQAMQDDIAGAIDHAKSSIAIDPTDSMAERTWANVLVGQGDDAGALPHFAAALQHDPHNAQLQEEYGSALLALGRFDEAIPHLDRALDRDYFATESTHRLLGKAYSKLGNFKRCIAEQKIALEMNPIDGQALDLLAQSQAAEGQLTEALDNYGRLAVTGLSTPRKAEVSAAISQILTRQGKYDSALKFMQQAAAFAPTDEKIKAQLADAGAKAKWAASTRPATTRSTTEPMK